MAKRIDVTGKKFGKLTVLSPAPTRKGHARWICRCDCGRQHETRYDALKSGKTKSCGCLHFVPKYRAKTKVPEKGHPFVREIFKRINIEMMTHRELEKRSGVYAASFKRWRDGSLPTLPMIEAVINALGGRMIVRWDDD